MTDKDQIIQLYRTMYQALIDKNRSVLDDIHENEFVLVHMTGLQQTKNVYIDAIMDGTLNYYSVKHESVNVMIDGDHATIDGQSLVSAAVFGGGRHTWPLLLKIKLVRQNHVWKIVGARASTYTSRS